MCLQHSYTELDLARESWLQCVFGGALSLAFIPLPNVGEVRSTHTTPGEQAARGNEGSRKRSQGLLPDHEQTQLLSPQSHVGTPQEGGGVVRKGSPWKQYGGMARGGGHMEEQVEMLPGASEGP